MRRNIIFCLVSLGLVSCQTTDPYTGEPTLNKSSVGALIGGALGAGVGALSGRGSTERRQKAMIGAGIGALTGGAAGHYMDRQEEELRRQMRGTGVSVTREGNSLRLNMPSDVTFDTGSANLRAQFINTLNSVGLVLNKYNRTLVDVVGHTDNVGGREYNYALSQRRASSVANYLQGRGVSNTRISQSGHGYDYPVASNNTREGRQLNRRVTISLRPLQM